MISSGDRIGRVVRLGDINTEPWRAIEADCLATGVQRFGPAYYSIVRGRPILWVHWIYKLGQAISYMQDRSAERLTAAGVPERIIEMVATGRDEHQLRLHKTHGQIELEQRLARGQRMLALVGVPGTGKSTAAAWTIFEAMTNPSRRSVIARWVHALELHRLSDWGRDDKRTLQRLKVIPWLVIDDLGLEDDRKSGKIAELLAARYDQRYAVTLCTTNLKPHQMSGPDGYGPRIISRFKEIGGNVWFKDVVRYDQQERL